MMDVIHLFDVGMFKDRDVVESRHLFAHANEGRIERAERLHIGFRSHQFIMIENSFANDILDRQDGFLKALFIPSFLGALLAFNRIGINIIAAIAIFCGDQIGGNALRHEIFLKDERRISHSAHAVAAHWDTAHGFDTATNSQIGFTGFHFGCCKIDRFETRTAETVHLNGGSCFSVTGFENC